MPDPVKTQSEEIIDLLGGTTVVGEVRAFDDFIARLRTGLSFSAVESLQKNLKISRESLSATLQISRRTLARRKALLTPQESDRLFRVARVFAYAIQVLGSRETATRWLSHENKALGGLRPLSLMDTDAGVETVQDVLGRIEYGVYS